MPPAPDVLANRSAAGAAYDGRIHFAKWTAGRFAGKDALEFGDAHAGVQFDLPKELSAATFLAWMRVGEPADGERDRAIAHGGRDASNSLMWYLKSDGRRCSGCGSARHALVQPHWPGVGRSRRVEDPPREMEGVVAAGLYLRSGRQTGAPVGTMAKRWSRGLSSGCRPFGSRWTLGNSGVGDVAGKQAFRGQIDEWMIFDAALSAEDMLRIYEAGNPEVPENAMPHR